MLVELINAVRISGLVQEMAGFGDVRDGSTTDSGGYPQFRPLSGVEQTSNSGRWTSDSSQQQKLAPLTQIERCTLTTLREKLVQIGGRIDRYGRYAIY